VHSCILNSNYNITSGLQLHQKLLNINIKS